MSRQANSKLKLEIDTTPSLPSTFAEIGGLESFSWDNSDEVQDGYFLSDGGAKHSDVTAGGLSISVSGKREHGDTGQDYIVGLVGAWGSSRKSTLQITDTVNGDVWTIPCSIEISAFGGGATEELEAFECVFHNDGIWTVSA